MNSIKPIETYYNGYRFRSRLEARWAVFFDSVGIEYQYEPEGFAISNIRYLPDFYLPKADRWVEIKSKKLSKSEIEKCSAFCEAQDQDGVKFTIFIGQPFDNLLGMKQGKDAGTVAVTLDPNEASIMGIQGFSYEWKTYDYGKPGGEMRHIEEDKALFINPDLCEEAVLTRFIPMLWHDANVTKEVLIAGTLEARQARFEYGETPIIK